jgi:tetratricopeptide (TPR) repeat protein
MDEPAPIDVLKQRLGEATTEAARVAVLVAFRDRAATLPFDEVVTCLRAVVERAREARNFGEWAVAGVALSEICRSAGDIKASLEFAGVVQEAASASGNPDHQGQYLYLVGRAHEVQDEHEIARDWYERSLDVWRKAGNTRGVGAALNQLGSMAILRGQASDALQYFQECLKVDDELGDTRNGAIHQHNVGWAFRLLGRLDDALESYYRALALSEQHPELLDMRPATLNSLGGLFLDREMTAKAVGIFRMAMHEAERNEVRPDNIVHTTAGLGLAHHRQGDLASAHQAYTRSLALAEESGNRHAAAIALWRMAELALDMGQLDRCRELAERSAVLARQVGLPCEESQAARVLAELHATRGELEQARGCFEQALTLLGDLDDGVDMARVRLHYGRHLLEHGESAAGTTHLKISARAFRKLGIVAEAHEVNRLLFREEMAVDGEAALLHAISGLASLGVEPRVLLERALGLLLEGFGFESAAVFVRGRPLLVVGHPKLARFLRLDADQELVATDSILSWPVRCGASPLGRICLERATPAATGQNHLVLETIANLLASPILRVADLETGVGDERPALAGLRYQGLVGRNQRMADVLATVCAVASESVPVLIRGEAGTGKELVARALHESGVRAAKPFAVVNCAGVPEKLLEVELFGRDDGAAAGEPVYKGKFETAEGGTVFLDEVGELSPALQSNLLRVLRDRSIDRAGGRGPVSVDGRVVAATTRPLGQFVAEGKFSEDLCLRLIATVLALPSLNERPEDFPNLVRHLVRLSSQEFGRHVAGVSPEVMARLTTHRWLGNVRELEYVIDRSVMLADGDTVQLHDLPPDLQSPSAG